MQEQVAVVDPAALRSAAGKVLIRRRSVGFLAVVGDDRPVIEACAEHHALSSEYVDDILEFVVVLKGSLPVCGCWALWNYRAPLTYKL